jgi:hypothetical protein
MLYNNYIDKIKEILPKNMKKEKIESIIENINEIIKLSRDSDYSEKDIQEIKEKKDIYKRENTQLRLDNLKLHEENKKLHEIILKLNQNIEDVNKINKELSEIVEKLENIDINNTVGIYTEEE